MRFRMNSSIGNVVRPVWSACAPAGEMTTSSAGGTMMTISDPLPSANRCTDRRHTVPHRMVLVLADRIPLMGRLMDRTARMVPDGPPTAREAAVSLADRTLARPHTVRMAHPGRHTVPASPPANPVRSPRAAPTKGSDEIGSGKFVGRQQRIEHFGFPDRRQNHP